MSRLGIYASQISGHLTLPTSYESIATVAVSSNQASIQFTSIPSTYTHLQIRYIARDTAASAGADDMFMSFNSGASATYSWHRFIGDGGTIQSAGSSNDPYIALSAAAISRGGNTSGIFSGGIIDIFEYKNTNILKSTRALYGFDRNTAGNIVMGSGNWYGTTNAITSIKFTAESSNSFVQYSNFALYGIKG